MQGTQREQPKKAQKKREKKPYKVLIFVALFLLIGWAFLCLYLFKANHVTVRGPQHLSENYVLSKVFPKEEDRRLYKIIGRFIKKTPDDVLFKVTGFRPTGINAIEITIEEAAPCCQIFVGADRLLLTGDGHVLSISGGDFAGVPKAAGLDISAYTLYEIPETNEPAKLIDALFVIKSVAAEGISYQEISCKGGSYTLDFGEVRVALGSSAHLTAKLNEMKAQMPYYQGLVGTMHLENCDGSEGQTFFFETDP